MLTSVCDFDVCSALASRRASGWAGTAQPLGRVGVANAAPVRLLLAACEAACFPLRCPQGSRVPVAAPRQPVGLAALLTPASFFFQCPLTSDITALLEMRLCRNPCTATEGHRD